MTHQKKIRHLPFEILVSINRESVSLTKEKHAYGEIDERNIRRLLHEVEETANKEERLEAVLVKVCLLTFKIANGQYFHEDNKRTALTAAQMFLRGNGFTIDIKDKELITVLDEVGVGKASLSKVDAVIRRLIRHD